MCSMAATGGVAMTLQRESKYRHIRENTQTAARNEFEFAVRAADASCGWPFGEPGGACIRTGGRPVGRRGHRLQDARGLRRMWPGA
jgi:hypothetical protein